MAVAAGLYLAFLVGAGATSSTQIVITATVTADPCTVSSESENQTVQLGDVNADTLQNTGATSLQKDFSLSMTCPTGTTGVTYTFSGTADSVDASNFRNNGTASKVAVRLYKNDGTIIAPGNSYTRSVRAGTVTEALKTAMYSNGLALPGTVSSTITINMTYQ